MKCEYCGYDGDGFEEGEFGFWCPDCQGLLYKNGKEDYSQADIILEKPVSDHRPIIQKSRLKKQLSPLRYPGGKSKMIDQLLPYIKGKKYFVEAFCGGASFGLSLLESGMIEKLILNDLDPNVYAFWDTVCNEKYEELIDKIRKYQPSRESYFLYQKRMLKASISTIDRAFYFLVINRCSFSGIQTANPKSNMEDRWLPDTLIKRIEKIHSMSDRIEVTNKNAMELIEEMYWDSDTCIFVDPPYIEKGDCLYPVKFHLHHELAKLITELLRETICNDPQVCRIVDLPVYYELETNNGNRDYRIQIGGHYMNYNTVYVGMDVHKESFTLCSCKYEDEKASHYQRTPASYKNVLRYLAFLRTIYGEYTRFVCGYEAGCLGYSLYHQLENFNVECVILAPTTMLEQRSKRRIKTDKRDAEIIARSLAQHNYSPVHIPTETDNQTKEFIRMRDDHKAELKKIKQQILSFCLRQGYQYDGSGNWTAKHVKWLRSLKPAGLYKEILDEYLLTYTILTDKLNRLDQRIEELASKEEYTESVSKLTCFLGIKTHTALSVIVEVGDFQRFVSARKFAGYLGLVPGQHSSGDDRNGLGITKAGNTHVRRLLVESAQSYTRGKIGYKSRVLRSRQAGNSPQVINYADRANERLRRRYYKMVLKDGKKYNIAKTAIARELACFIWGMMTDNIY